MTSFNQALAIPPVRETGWIAVYAGWEWNASINWVGDVEEPIWGNTASQSQISVGAKKTDPELKAISGTVATES